MHYEWDDNKRKQNLKQHGVDFYSAYEFDWETAITAADDRIQHNEKRLISLGLIKNRLHVLVFTYRRNSVRIISLRKANKREIKKYEKT